MHANAIKIIRNIYSVVILQRPIDQNFIDMLIIVEPLFYTPILGDILIGIFM